MPDDTKPTHTRGGARMTKAQLRETALRAARSYLREQGIDPAQVDAEAALAALDDLYRIDQATLASLWYGQTSDNQIRLFRREWRKARIEAMEQTRVTVIRNLITGKFHLPAEDGSKQPLCGCSLPRFMWEFQSWSGDVLHRTWMCKKCLAKL